MSDEALMHTEKWHEGLCLISHINVTGMVTLKGDLASEEMKKAVKSAIGLTPPVMGTIKTGKKGAIAWMAADELMLFCDYASIDKTLEKCETALTGTHSLVCDVSDARAIFKIDGAGARNILAKGTPTDLTEFTQGSFKRSRIGQIAAAFWMESPETTYVMCFRSVGEHMFDWLKVANETDATLDLYS